MHKPPPFTLILLSIGLLSGCAATKLVNEWQAEGGSAGPYASIMVVGISDEAATRRSFEDQFSAKLTQAGVSATPGHTLLPSTGKAEESALLKAVASAGAGAVLMTRVVRIEDKTQYKPAQVRMVPAPGLYGYYTSAWTYYEPAQVYQYKIAVLETNLWDAKTRQLVWSGTTETFQPGELRKEVDEFSDLLIKTFRGRGLIGAKAAGK